MRTLPVAVLVIALAFGACATKSAVSPSASAAGAEPKTAQELQAVAQLHFDSFSAGDYGAYWDDFDTASKAVISRAEYVQRLKSCMQTDPNRSAPFSVHGVSQNADGTWTVTVRYTRGPTTFQTTFPAVYENGRWRFAFTADARRAMQMPVSQYLATQCHH
jgi:hypothetical protein